MSIIKSARSRNSSTRLRYSLPYKKAITAAIATVVIATSGVTRVGARPAKNMTHEPIVASVAMYAVAVS
ncbi:hypothetical protein D3C81_2194840 [compost metagenome]